MNASSLRIFVLREPPLSQGFIPAWFSSGLKTLLGHHEMVSVPTH